MDLKSNKMNDSDIILYYPVPEVNVVFIVMEVLETREDDHLIESNKGFFAFN